MRKTGSPSRLVVAIKRDGYADQAVPGQAAALIDRVAIGGNDDVAIKDQPSGAFLAHFHRAVGGEADDIAVRLHNRFGMPSANPKRACSAICRRSP